MPATLTGTHDGINFDGRFTVATMPGVAWYLLGYATEMTEETCELACDDAGDHDHTADCEAIYGEPEEVDRPDVVRAVMVGDDRVHEVDVSDLTEISEDDYCPGCGQTGCGH